MCWCCWWWWSGSSGEGPTWATGSGLIVLGSERAKKSWLSSFHYHPSAWPTYGPPFNAVPESRFSYNYTPVPGTAFTRHSAANFVCQCTHLRLVQHRPPSLRKDSDKRHQRSEPNGTNLLSVNTEEGVGSTRQTHMSRSWRVDLERSL